MTDDLLVNQARLNRRSDLPRVSIIIPVRNEANGIRRSLGSILRQDYPLDRLEVIIVDGLSQDGTRELVRAMSAKKPNIMVVDNPHQIVPHALNIGILASHGDTVIILGGHSWVPRDYVRKCVALLHSTNADCVGGAVDAVGVSWVSEAIAAAQRSFFGTGGAAFRTGRGRAGSVDTVAFGAYRREVFGRIGLFDQTLARDQDYEFNYRLRRAGGKIVYHPAIRSRYYCRGSILELARQYFRNGFWKARSLLKDPKALLGRHLAPPTLSFAFLLGGIASLAFPWFRPVYTRVLLAYCCADLCASFLTAVRRGWRYLPLLPLIFPVMHFAWGFGVWAGLFRWGPERIMHAPRGATG